MNIYKIRLFIHLPIYKIRGLSDNDFSGTIPESMGNLTKLTIL